ncbi:MAG: class I SAM-dependent methyltransferase [Clostridia bacterium]|nr:class I SAM-dependent methyltransferase [Clostridia bacterium]
MAAYEALADVYDLLMDDVDYDGWASHYLALLARAGVTPRSLCDCACGTGALSVRFAEAGIRVTGADLSAAMLARAQENARRRGVQAMFVRQDMRALELPRPVDALVCGCDGVNYLLDDKDLRAFFGRARAALRPGGALAFDISSAWKLEHTLGDGFFGEDRDEVTYLWSNRFDPAARTVTMDLTFFTPRPDGLYRRSDETHVQKAHAPEALRGLLEESGFRDIRVLGDRTFEAPAADAPRIFFLAVRE